MESEKVKQARKELRKAENHYQAASANGASNDYMADCQGRVNRAKRALKQALSEQD